VSHAARRWWLFGVGAAAPPRLTADDTVATAETTTPGSQEEVAHALDLVARMLRLTGEVPVLPDQSDVAQLRSTFEAWARHILTLAPPPGDSAPVQHRAWRALAAFLTEHRHVEQELVAMNLADLRRAVVIIADAVRGALVHERADTSALHQAVGALRAAAADGSLGELRQEVSRATDQLLSLAAERDERQQELAEQVAELSEQVHVLVQEVRQAQQASMLDPLTGLLNRAGFEAAIRRALGLPCLHAAG
jgi:chorismate mutase